MENTLRLIAHFIETKKMKMHLTPKFFTDLADEFKRLTEENENLKKQLTKDMTAGVYDE